MLTKERLDAIRSRCEAATPGPWESKLRGVAGKDIYEYGGYEVETLGNNPEKLRFYPYYGGGQMVEKDAVFIAAARSDVPELLAEVARLTAEIRTAANSLDNSGDKYGRYAQQILWDALEGVE